MTNWQIFALSSPVIIAAVMWLQGLAESHFEFSGSSQKSSATLGEGVSAHVETSTSTLAEAAEFFRILREATRLEAVKAEPELKKETSSTRTGPTGSDIPPKRIS